MTEMYEIRFSHCSNHAKHKHLQYHWFAHDEWANNTLETHVELGAMVVRIGDHEWDQEDDPLMALFGMEDMEDLCAEGFMLVYYWLHNKCKDMLDGWSWYVYVSRLWGEKKTNTYAPGWTICVLLRNPAKSTAEAEAVSEKLWVSYRDYHSNILIYETERYGSRELTIQDYETMKCKLHSFQVHEIRRPFDSMVIQRMVDMPRIGDVFRTALTQIKEALLWCDSSEDCGDQVKASIQRLWYPVGRRPRSEILAAL